MNNRMLDLPHDLSQGYKILLDDIEFARKRRKWSQEELSVRAQLSPKTYKNLISRRNMPRIDVLLRVFWVLGMADRFFQIGDPLADRDYVMQQRREITKRKNQLSKSKLNF